MKIIRNTGLFLTIAFFLFGCGANSGIEGKLLDAKGQPMSGVKMIATQVQPVKGYEQFETTTGNDGNFVFPKVFPLADYIIKPWSENWKTNVSVTVRSGSEKQVVKVPSSALVVRFTLNNDDIIVDLKTDLKWVSVSGRDVTWYSADKFAKEMKRGSYVDWKLPTRAELRTLYDYSLRTEYKIDPIFQFNSSIAWTSEGYDEKAAWGFSFDNGLEDWYKRDQTNCDRILLVRK